jgi:hypothetical protein
MNTPSWISQLGRSANRNSPAILSGVAVAGVLTTAYLTARASVKADRKLEGLETTPKQKIQGCWKLYIPAAASGAATIACIVGANQIGARRHAAMVGAYTLAEAAFRQYKEEVVAEIGEIKERGIRDKAAIKQMENNPVKDSQVIITGGGDQLCYDTFTGRYFRSDIEAIRRAENEVNRRVLTDMHASHNEFYALIGLADALAGDELGWNIDNLMELAFTAHLSEDGTPCLAINYTRLPRCDYYKF